MEFVAGDIISTGTPTGVGIGTTSPRFLKAGDTVEVSISGLGTLTNTFGLPHRRHREFFERIVCRGDAPSFVCGFNPSMQHT
ncbi:hypothetical protein GNZ13_20620 [Paraburkholderia sp. 5N]|uniref:Fumarylacetoacetase-like C-terminal domain-containing protein n=2 Tax=Paraburkholderia elongata TaxID=2675747 RepID=A0A972NQT3_9BURK|nr:hypothetical protein [Paraburkholderia elongata]